MDEMKMSADEASHADCDWCCNVCGAWVNQCTCLPSCPKKVQRLPAEKEQPRVQCPKCKMVSGDDWTQCKEDCPMPMSPHFKPKAEKEQRQGEQLPAEKNIRVELLEELITWNYMEADAMRKTIELAGDHYTYRDKLRRHEGAISDLHMKHLYELGYPEHRERMNKLRASLPIAQESASEVQPRMVEDEDAMIAMRHLLKRMYDECGSEAWSNFYERVKSGEHDVPSPWAWPKASEAQPLEQQRCEWHGRYLGEHDWVDCHGGGMRCSKCKLEVEPQREEEAQPLSGRLQDLGSEFGCPAGVRIMDWIRIQIKRGEVYRRRSQGLCDGCSSELDDAYCRKCAVSMKPSAVEMPDPLVDSQFIRWAIDWYSPNNPRIVAAIKELQQWRKWAEAARKDETK